MKLLTFTNVVWFLIYVSMITSIIWGLNSYRTKAISQFSSPQSQADWNAWVEEVKSQEDQDNSVARRVPKSGEPPTLVLLRDHHVSCVGGALMLSSALFFTLMVMIRGSLHGPTIAEVEDAVDASEFRHE
jgi:hypothetical protein